MREGKYSPVYGSMPLSMPMPATLVAVRGGGIGEGVQDGGVSMSKISRDFNSLNELLYEQLHYLRTSCKLFDDGQSIEAKRIATSIRVLLHDTSHSKSLLVQTLQKDNLLFLDSSIGSPFSGSQLSYEGLSYLSVGLSGSKFVPVLDDTPITPQRRKFEQWWNRVIIRTNSSGMFSRKDIILYLANKDGGAHVDPEIEEKFYKLQKIESTGWTTISGGTSKTIMGIELVSARQIGHEILRTLGDKNTYTAQKIEGAVFGGGTMIVSGYVEHDRNKKCPCGSGKKFKKCCM